MNLSITNECNRNCEYCFQKSWYLANNKEDIKEMSLETIEKILKLLPEKTSHFKIMGGEPLLYSNLKELLNLLRENELTVTFISNISVKTEYLEYILNNYSDVITSWLINTDYPSSQESLFLKNINLFKNKSIHLSSTLLPSTEKIINSSNRLLKIIGILGNKVKIRVSPMSPFDKNNISYNYTQDIIRFISKLAVMKIKDINFDCVVNRCELNYIKIEEHFKKSGINVIFNNKSCVGAFDILVDNSVIYCSSTYNLIRLDNILDYHCLGEAQTALDTQVKDYWNKFPLSCNYKKCLHYENKSCVGLCPAKNYTQIM